MTAAAMQTGTRRIVVTLGAAPGGRAPLAIAVRLAGLLGAELEGVFIEDINLIQLAGLPFLRELSPWSLAEQAVSSQRMERQLRAMARQARTLLEQEAGKLDVPWTFQVWRGHTGTEALTRAFSADILSLGRLSALASCRHWARTVRPPPVGAVLAGIGVLAGLSEPATRAITTAARLARDLGTSLTVFLPEGGTDRRIAPGGKAACHARHARPGSPPGAARWQRHAASFAGGTGRRHRAAGRGSRPRAAANGRTRALPGSAGPSGAAGTLKRSTAHGTRLQTHFNG